MWVSGQLRRHDPEEPETQKGSHGKYPKNWISILLKQVQSWLRDLVTAASFNPKVARAGAEAGACPVQGWS